MLKESKKKLKERKQTLRESKKLQKGSKKTQEGSKKMLKGSKKDVREVNIFIYFPSTFFTPFQHFLLPHLKAFVKIFYNEHFRTNASFSFQKTKKIYIEYSS